jgi:hypothetical protein
VRKFKAEIKVEKNFTMNAISISNLQNTVMLNSSSKSKSKFHKCLPSPKKVDKEGSQDYKENKLLLEYE